MDLELARVDEPGALGSVAGNASTQGLRMMTGKQCDFDVYSLLGDTAWGAFGGVASRANPGLTAARNSLSAIYKQMATKLKNGTISTVSTRTAIKMFLGRGFDTAFFENTIIVDGAVFGVLDGLASP